jgi:hypothetical protein
LSTPSAPTDPAGTGDSGSETDVAFGPELHSGLRWLACNMQHTPCQVQHAFLQRTRHATCNIHAYLATSQTSGRPDQDRTLDCVGWLFDEAPLSEIASEMIEAAVHAQLDRVGLNRP